MYVFLSIYIISFNKILFHLKSVGKALHNSKLSPFLFSTDFQLHPQWINLHSWYKHGIHTFISEIGKSTPQITVLTLLFYTNNFKFISSQEAWEKKKEVTCLRPLANLSYIPWGYLHWALNNACRLLDTVRDLEGYQMSLLYNTIIVVHEA